MTDAKRPTRGSPQQKRDSGPVRHHELLYTPAEERFDRIVRLAQQALTVPVAGMMLTNDGKQWFKSVGGWSVTELPEEHALCDWALESDGPTIVQDMSEDARTTQHPFVRGAPKFRFYASYPLLDSAGWPIGGLCVLDVKPRTLTTAEQQSLLDLAEIAQREVLAEQPPSPDTSLASKLGIARRQNMIDPLTRLWNLRGAHVLIRSAFRKADHRKQSVCAAAIDIEGFAAINERYGHNTGDEVLHKLATRLVNAVRGQDLVFRLFDDRFLLLMANVGRIAAERALERVQWMITGASVPTRSGDLHIGVTTGLAVREFGDNVTVQELLSRAEQALKDSRRLADVGVDRSSSSLAS